MEVFIMLSAIWIAIWMPDTKALTEELRKIRKLKEHELGIKADTLPD